MRDISDFTIEEAMDFWGDNAEAIHNIFSNETVAKAMREEKPTDACKVICKECHKDIKQILEWIDPETPITPFNLFPRIMGFITATTNKEVEGFFTLPVQTEALTASGVATENTGENES